MRKLKSMITSKAMITAVSLLLQLAIIFVILFRFTSAYVYYLLFSYALSVVMCLIVINKNTNSGYKIGWLVILIALPLFGVFLYLTVNGESFRGIIRKRSAHFDKRAREELGKSSSAAIQAEDAALQSAYLTKTGGFPTLENTYAKYFDTGEALFKSLLSDLEGANHHIYLEYFIFKKGYMWDEILKVLVKKVGEGVDIRIIADDFGSIDGFGRKDKKRLRELGIKIQFFNPFVPVISGVLNNRDHRKICVIDTKIAYCGGVNIADEYINLDNKYGYFKDSGIAVYGEAAHSFEVFFVSLWDGLTGEKTKIPDPVWEKSQNGVYQPYTDSPLDREYVSKNVYMNMISRAKRYVYISTPYFVVDDEMLSVIQNTAKSGVDVRIVVPHVPDKLLVNQVTKSYYERLISSGVRVYEYEKGFNHSKLVLVDDEIATVGSVNFDYRSFYLSFECGLWMYATPSVISVKNDLVSMMKDSIEIDEKAAKSNIFLRILRAILSTFSPML